LVGAVPPLCAVKTRDIRLVNNKLF
jgi:hypothetical protein